VEERNPLDIDLKNHLLAAGSNYKYPRPLIFSYELLTTCRLIRLDAKHAALDKVTGPGLRW
jgi:hypothetical protein